MTQNILVNNSQSTAKSNFLGPGENAQKILTLFFVGAGEGRKNNHNTGEVVSGPCVNARPAFGVTRKVKSAKASVIKVFRIRFVFKADLKNSFFAVKFSRNNLATSCLAWFKRMMNGDRSTTDFGRAAPKPSGRNNAVGIDTFDVKSGMIGMCHKRDTSGLTKGPGVINSGDDVSPKIYEVGHLQRVKLVADKIQNPIFTIGGRRIFKNSLNNILDILVITCVCHAFKF